MGIETFLELIRKRNPNEPEFLQAVEEVVDAIWPCLTARREFADAKILERLMEPERVVMFRVAWTDDSGRVQVNRGFRVQMNSALGPYKGGLRFHPTVNLSVLKFLAFEQVFKNALTALPLGGGKGGSDFDPKGKSDAEVMRFCQAFMTELARHVGANTDVPAGDIGVGAREIGYLFGQYKRLRNEFTGVLTGKGPTWGGSHLRPEATGYGLVYFTREMLCTIDDGFEGKRVVISGSGNVAQFACEKATELGARVIAMSDSAGTIHDPDGIDAEKLAFIKVLKNERRGRIKEYASKFGVTYQDGARPWGIATDVALPCATQNELDLDDAKRLVEQGCKVVAEGANMPSTADAASYFEHQAVLYGPGKAANAGGVATSGFEMSQNSLRLQWTPEEVDHRLVKVMRKIHASCVEHGRRDDGHIDYVVGANVAGFLRVAEAMMAQGVL